MASLCCEGPPPRAPRLLSRGQGPRPSALARAQSGRGDPQDTPLLAAGYEGCLRPAQLAGLTSGQLASRLHFDLLLSFHVSSAIHSPRFCVGRDALPHTQASISPRHPSPLPPAPGALLSCVQPV